MGREAEKRTFLPVWTMAAAIHEAILPMTSSCCVVSDNGRTPDSGNLAASRHVLRETCIPYIYGCVQKALDEIPSDSSLYVEGSTVPFHDLSTATCQTDTTLNGLAETALPVRQLPGLDQALQKTRVETHHQSCNADCSWWFPVAIYEEG